MAKKGSNPPPPEDIRLAGRMVVSVSEMAKAFTEWDRRYREDPDKFMSEASHLLKETPETYGDACSPYFIKLLNEIKATT